MMLAFVTLIVAGVAAPFFAFAWAMQRRDCPHCGQSIEPDPNVVRVFSGH
jgi:hypothetical protein